MENNNVNHPQHYTNCSLECIDVMKLMLGGHNVCVFCIMNAFKYMWRYKHKNGKEDLKKAKWYLDYACTLKEYLESEPEEEFILNGLINLFEKTIRKDFE